MRTTKRVCAGVLQVLLLAACGSPEEQTERAPPPVEDTAFGDMVGTMEKARGVEDTAREHKQALDEALERSEGSSEP